MPLLGRLAYRMKPELTIRSAILLTVSRSTRGDLGSAQEAIGDLVRIQEQVGQVDPSAAAAIGFARFVELICAGRVAEAADYLEERRVDADTGVGVYTMLLGNLRQCGGHLADAERLTTLAVDQLRWRDGLGLLGVALGYQANALAKRGQVDRARRILDGMTPSQREERHAFIQVAEAEAWISIHAGEHDRAVGLVTAAAERGLGSRAVFLSALATCILIRLGRVEAAADLLERLADATTTDLEIVCCIRDLAVVLRDRDHQALPAVLRRVEAAGQAPTVLDAAHHAMAARPGPELRRKLDLLSIRLSTSIDEPALHARKPLLSPRELEVARAAAARRRSKEIAVDLGTSARTVDTQLQSVYRKLEITGRDELRTALDEVGLLDENPPKDGATEHHRRA